MKGNTLTQFMDDLYSCGGPEKEIIYNNEYSFFIEAELGVNGETILRVDEYSYKDNITRLIQVHRFTGKDLFEAVQKFEVAPIFAGKTIYEVEQDIIVLYG